MIFLKYLKELPVQLILAIVAALLLGKVLDASHISLFYTVSSCFVEVLLFILPLMVFSFIFSALRAMQNRSLFVLVAIFAGVTLSNCLALCVAYSLGVLVLPQLGAQHSGFIQGIQSEITALFHLPLPTLFGTETALALGIVLGIAINRLKDQNPFKKNLELLSTWLNSAISLFLRKVFTPFLPLYVFSFCLKLSYEEALNTLFAQYGKVFLFSMALVAGYLFVLYFVGSRFDLKATFNNLRTMLPAGITGFSTMSSAATMPVTLSCVEKTTKDKNFTNLIIPSTANIHMLGDDLTITITSMTLLSVFGIAWPDIAHFLPFALAFSLAKLSCVGIPGASVLVILPVLQSYLGFTPEMISILTTIYVLQDPFGTAANVMGNGAFALLIQRVMKKQLLKSAVSAPLQR